MTDFDRNRAALDARFPGMLVDLCADGNPFEERPVWQVSRSGHPTARWREVTLASTFDPVVEARKAVPPISDRVDFVVAAGLGLGYGIEALAAAVPDVPIVVVEPSAWWFCQLLEQRDLTTVLANPLVSFVVGAPPDHVGAYLERFRCKNLVLMPCRPVTQLFPSWFAGLGRALDEYQALARVNVATLERFAPMWLANLARNESWWQGAEGSESHRPALHRVRDLAGLVKGGRVVIAAAGPSLAGHLSWIREHRRQVLLIAVDTSWKSVTAAGLVPDVLVVMDGQFWNARHVDPPVDPPTIVVSEWISHPSTLRLAPDRVYLASTSVPFLEEREQRRWGTLGGLKSGGSVATVAWELALHLGASEVVFAGLDLGYPPGGSHVRGSQFEERHHRQSQRLRPAETASLAWLGEPGLARLPANDGGTVISDQRMVLYRRWLEGSVARNPNVRVWNLSLRGSFIEGVKTPSPEWDQWPLQLVPEWPKVDLEIQGFPDADQLPDDEEPFPQVLSDVWLRAWEAKARRRWGIRGWKILGAVALETWRTFPSRRSEAAVREAWIFEQRWKSALFRSGNEGPIR